MERVKRKESDTWKIVDSAHEAGFILTLVVVLFPQYFSIFWVFFFQVDFLDISKFPSYSQTGYRSLEKGFHCEDSLLHVLTPAPMPQLLPLSNPPSLLPSPASQEEHPSPKSSPCASLYPPRYCHHLSMWLGPQSATLSVEQVLRRTTNFNSVVPVDLNVDGDKIFCE